MNPPSAELELERCDACHGRFLPHEGPCPRCGSSATSAYSVPALGSVLAATSLEAPAEGWSAPHRLALVEVADGVRLLAIADGPLPARGSVVEVRKDGPVFRCSGPDPSGRERGEGESPESGLSGAPFEPPR